MPPNPRRHRSGELSPEQIDAFIKAIPQDSLIGHTIHLWIVGEKDSDFVKRRVHSLADATSRAHFWGKNIPVDEPQPKGITIFAKEDSTIVQYIANASKTVTPETRVVIGPFPKIKLATSRFNDLPELDEHWQKEEPKPVVVIAVG